MLKFNLLFEESGRSFSMYMNEVEYEHVVKTATSQEEWNVGTKNISVPLSNVFSSNILLSNIKRRSLTIVEDYSDGQDYVSTSSKTFQTSSSHAEYSWCLSEDMLQYLLKQFYTFITQTNLEDNILNYNPNQITIKLLPIFVTFSTSQGGSGAKCWKSKTFHKMQQKLLNFFGLLTQLW